MFFLYRTWDLNGIRGTRLQVGGHTQFLQLDQSTVCKPLIPRELSFYLNAPPEVRSFTPKYKGKAMGNQQM